MGVSAPKGDLQRDSGTHWKGAPRHDDTASGALPRVRRYLDGEPADSFEGEKGARQSGGHRIASAPSSCARIPVTRRRVLIVDDEVRVAEAIARVLSFDFDVTVVNSAREALTLLLAGESFQLVLCDLMMSEMSGMDFYDEVAQSLPELVGNLAFMTGGAFTARARHFVETVRCPCLDKPVDLKALRELILR